MKKILFFLLSAFFLFGPGLPLAQADTDYHCLSMCTNAGGSSGVCLPQCTYNLPLKKAPSALKDKNDVFTAPAPVNQLILPSSQASAKPSGEKDYDCMTQCTQNGMQYKLCNQMCVKSTCKASSALCVSQAGRAPAMPLSTSVSR